MRALSLMEMQRHTQLMYTSCGWFFDDISGIETVQIIAYAARVIQLAQELFLGRSRGPRSRLPRQARCRPNPTSPPHGDGARIYTKQCLRMELSLEQVAAHYAISSVFSSFADETEIFCYRVHRISYEILTSGRGRLALGRAASHQPSPASRRYSPSPFFTLATRTSPPPSKPTITPKMPRPSRNVSTQAREQVLQCQLP